MGCTEKGDITGRCSHCKCTYDGFVTFVKCVSAQVSQFIKEITIRNVTEIGLSLMFFLRFHLKHDIKWFGRMSVLKTR